LLAENCEKYLTVRLTPKQLQELNQVAEAWHVSRGKIIRQLIDKFLQSEKKRKAKQG
jgi:metal-responsive CopG/Arc/MetJ family transcriptional regulator